MIIDNGSCINVSNKERITFILGDTLIIRYVV
jgi:hypothetical protein